MSAVKKKDVTPHETVISALIDRVSLRAEYDLWLDAPVEIVFDYVTSQAHICDMVPGLHSVAIQLPDAASAGDEHARRICDFGNDMIIQEVIVLWEPPFRQGYRIVEPNPFGLTDHLAIMTASTVEGGTELRWRHTFNHADLPAITALLDETFAGVTANLISHFGGKSAAPPVTQPSAQSFPNSGNVLDEFE